jgi:glycosyltransferase involved in cell wall biosynthesis
VVHLRIWHLDTIGNPVSVDGIATGLWLLAATQAELGHEVTLFARTEVDHDGHRRAAESGLRLARFQRSVRSQRADDLVDLLAEHQPDVVHFHAGWVPSHPITARRLRKAGVPYVVTPHGSYSPMIRAAKRRRRDIYARLVERPYLRLASGCVVNIRQEIRQVEAMAGPKTALAIEAIPFPMDISAPVTPWSPDLDRPTVVFLGRFEPFQKGLDRLVEIARRCPEVTFELYGREPEEGSATLGRLRAEAPDNVHFLDPVFGDEKYERLRRATVYLQPSRFDGFPLSVADALLQGVPCLVAEELGVAEELTARGAATTVPADPDDAAAVLRRTIADEGLLQALSAAGPGFALEHFDPHRSATAHLEFYAALS